MRVDIDDLDSLEADVLDDLEDVDSQSPGGTISLEQGRRRRQPSQARSAGRLGTISTIAPA